MRNDMLQRRAVHIALTLSVLWAVGLLGSPALAQQAFRQQYTAGRQILFFVTPSLTPGNYYEFETSGLSAGADTVMTLRSGTSGSLLSGATVTGADTCPRRSTALASCFNFYMNPAQFPTARQFVLIVRSWQSNSSGTASVRIQRTSSGGAITDINCGTQLPIQTGCWSRWPDLSFGSAVAHFLGPSATNYHFETRERAGSTSSPHVMFFTGSKEPVQICVAILNAG